MSRDGETKLQEAIGLARSILDSMDKGKALAASLRQCERLGQLIGDEFIQAYAARALEPDVGSPAIRDDIRYAKAHTDAKGSGIYQYLNDVHMSGDPIWKVVLMEGRFGWLERSVPEAETFVATARKRMKYSVSETEFTESVENTEAVLERVRNRLYRYASATLHRLLFEQVQESVMEATRRKVDGALAKISPQALEKFAVAYDELHGSSAENWTNACTAVRRVLLDFADAVFPPQDDTVDGRCLDREHYVNRL